MTQSNRLAQAKQRRLDNHLLSVALHLDYVLCPVLVGGFALLVKAIS